MIGMRACLVGVLPRSLRSSTAILPQCTATTRPHLGCSAAATRAAMQRRTVRNAHRQALPPHPRRRGSSSSVGSTGGGEAVSAADDSASQAAFSRALLLSFLASQNRSLFGAKCMVDTLVELYRRGYSLVDVKLMIALGTLGKLEPLLGDIMLAWASVIMMALQAVGLQLYPEGEARAAARAEAGATEDDSDYMAHGLRGLVRGCVERFLAGETLFRLQLQQSMAGQVAGDPEAAGVSPAVQMMQQNSRLAIIALEVVRDAGLPTVVPLVQAPPPLSGGEGEGDAETEGEEAARSVSAPRGSPPLQSIDFIAGFLEVEDGAGSVSPAGAPTGVAAERRARSAAVRLLVCFMGAALGSQYCAWGFVEEAARCYCTGWTADELFLSLQDEEFAQSGGVLPIGVASLPGGNNVSATLFARWLSSVYIALAQLGVRHPGATEQAGWAWVCSLGGDDTSGPGSMEPHGMADFVSNTLRLAASADGAELGAPGDMAGGAMLHMLRPGMDGSAPQEGFGAGIEDPELHATSPFALVIRQQISLVRMTRELVVAQAAAQQAAAVEQSVG